MKCEKCEEKFHKYIQQGGYVDVKWFCNLCISNQPERLNPEDVRNNVCDSPNSTNK